MSEKKLLWQDAVIAGSTHASTKLSVQYMLMLPYFLLVILGVPILVILFVMGMFGWQYFNTRGVAYFGRPQAER